MRIQTDREIKANRPDIVIKNKQEKSCLIIDMSIPTEKNTSVKVTEKLSKYKDLEIEIERMWGMKATTIPVVIGALGLIKKGLEKYTKQMRVVQYTRTESGRLRYASTRLAGSPMARDLENKRITRVMS